MGLRLKLILLAVGLAVVSLLVALLWPSTEAQHEALATAPATPPAGTSSTSAIAATRDAGSAAASNRRADKRGAARPARSAEESKKAEASLIEQLIAIHAIASQAEVSDTLQKNAELAAKEVDRFCEESQKALQHSPFKDGSRQRDAASYLAPRIDWMTVPVRQGTLHLPQQLTDRMAAAGKTWPSAITATDLAPLDFTWMTDLRAFDCWNLTTDGPSLDPETVTPESDALPLPSYSLFAQWTKLRLAKALRTGSFPDASIDIQHLSDLLHSQGVLIAEMFAIAFLKMERDAFDYAVAQHLNVSGWSPLVTEDLDRLRTIERYGFAFFFPGVDPKVMKKALSCTPSPCAGLAEGAWSHTLIGDLSPEDTRDSFFRMADASNCDQGVLQTIRGSPSLSVEKAREMFTGPSPLLQLFPAAKP